MGRAAAAGGFDVFFFPTVYSFFPIPSRMPCVVCYHDTTAERFPHLVFPTRLNRILWRVKGRLARWQTTRAMTVSRTSGEDLEKILGIPGSKIDVVTEGADPEFRVLNDPAACLAARRRHGIPEQAPLLIYVGGLNPHKNLLGLLKALPAVLAARPDIHLAIVGDVSGKGFWDNVQELKAFISARPPLESHVHFTGFITDSQLVELLNASDALVFPSFWEGFGLPAVEAMACGLPVLASGVSSLPEVVGDAGLLFDPQVPEEISACILRFMQDSVLQRSLRENAVKRSREFSWERGAQLAEASLRRCYEERHGKR
jgi:alpha-1,3-rhamnosyl/mannosyltransferase